MKRVINLFPLVIVFLACNNNNQSKETSSNDSIPKKEEMRIQIPDKACYAGVQGKDSVFLTVERFPNVATGSLSYHFMEKDNNNGTLDGKIYGDTLIADYTFRSEGKSSVREVAFLLQDSTATEGYGTLEEKEGKMVIADRSKLVFKNSVVLKMISCIEQ